MNGDVALDRYISVLSSFLARRIDVADFESQYLNLFKQDDLIRPAEVFDILDPLFSDVDAYSRKPTGDEIDEDRLRQRATNAYRSLLRYADHADPSATAE